MISCGLVLFWLAAALFDEPYRPQFHFSPTRNWTNDPNGLVFYQGEYHLFFQFNPFGNEWGHMSWGHAVSPDLVHWRELPVALREENGIMMFSGSAVVDENNSSGFCSPARSCLVAIYTGHTSTRQTQNIAFSNDRGRTWTKYPGNPVIDLAMKDFRDPKVFWHAASRKWIMAAALPKERKVRFFASADLKHWTALSDFGPAGATGGDWECPDLFPLSIDGEPGRMRWVLSVNINPGGLNGGSANQYFVGDFDGTHFTNDNTASTTLWADQGKDFYASQSYNGIPASDGRRIWIGWFSNWLYARDEPTSPWRCIQSIPRALRLVKTAQGELRLAQLPVAELEKLREEGTHLQNSDIGAANGALHGFKSQTYEFAAVFSAESDISFNVRKGSSDRTVVGYVAKTHELFVDRAHSGSTAFSTDFPGRYSTRVEAPNGRVNVRVFVDRSSVEVFSGNGEAVLSDRIFPAADDNGIDIEGTGKLASFDLWPLRSAWKP